MLCLASRTNSHKMKVSCTPLTFGVASVCRRFRRLQRALSAPWQSQTGVTHKSRHAWGSQTVYSCLNIAEAAHCKIRALPPWANHSMCHIGKCWRSVACLFIGVSRFPSRRLLFELDSITAPLKAERTSIQTNTNMRAREIVNVLTGLLDCLTLVAVEEHILPYKWKNETG